MAVDARAAGAGPPCRGRVRLAAAGAACPRYRRAAPWPPAPPGDSPERASGQRARDATGHCPRSERVPRRHAVAAHRGSPPVSRTACRGRDLVGCRDAGCRACALGRGPLARAPSWPPGQHVARAAAPRSASALARPCRWGHVLGGRARARAARGRAPALLWSGCRGCARIGAAPARQRSRAWTRPRRRRAPASRRAVAGPPCRGWGRSCPGRPRGTGPPCQGWDGRARPPEQGRRHRVA